MLFLIIKQTGPAGTEGFHMWTTTSPTVWLHEWFWQTQSPESCLWCLFGVGAVVSTEQELVVAVKSNQVELCLFICHAEQSEQRAHYAEVSPEGKISQSPPVSPKARKNM